MNKRVFRLVSNAVRQRAIDEIWGAPEGYMASISEPTRSLEQNAAQWPILDALSKQLKWPVNGELVYMEPEEWKDVLTAAFRQETVRLAEGLNGGTVMLGMRTSEMSKAQFSAWIEFLKWFAADRNVKV